MGAMRIDAAPTRTGPTFVASRKEVRGVASFRSLRSVDIYASRERHCFIMMEDDSTLELRLRKTGTPAARAASGSKSALGQSGFDLMATAQKRWFAEDEVIGNGTRQSLQGDS